MSKASGKRKATAAKAKSSSHLDSPSPPPGAAPVEAPRTLCPAPTADEVIASMTRFMRERAKDHPEEAATLGLYIGVVADEFRALVPAPSVEEVVRLLDRFSNERAPDHPAESVIFARFVTRLSAAIAPTLARIIETTELLAPPKDDAVN